MDNVEKNTYVVNPNAEDFSELMLYIVFLRTKFGSQYKIFEDSKKDKIENPKSIKIDIQLLRKLEEGKSINTLVFAKYLEYLDLELVIRPKAKKTTEK